MILIIGWVYIFLFKGGSSCCRCESIQACSQGHCALCRLYDQTTIYKIQTQKGSTECLFILTRMQIFGEIPFVKPQNDTSATDTWLKTMKNEIFLFKKIILFWLSFCCLFSHSQHTLSSSSLFSFKSQAFLCVIGSGGGRCCCGLGAT